VLLSNLWRRTVLRHHSTPAAENGADSRRSFEFAGVIDPCRMRRIVSTTDQSMKGWFLTCGSFTEGKISPATVFTRPLNCNDCAVMTSYLRIKAHIIHLFLLSSWLKKTNFEAQSFVSPTTFLFPPEIQTPAVDLVTFNSDT